jgi:hypothetical protein
MGSRDTSYESAFSAVPTTIDDKQMLDNGTEEDYEPKSFCWNSKTMELCGRSIGSWMKLVAFMVLFSAGVAMFWGLCLWVFYQTLDNYTPKLQQTESFIGSNPGLGYRPMRMETDPYSSLVWFRHGGAGDWDDFKTELDQVQTI